MPKYELVVIFDPFLQEADQNAQIDRAKELLTRRGAEITNVDIWGRRRMTYAIKKKVEGFYVVVTFEGKLDGPAIAEVERNLRLNESVLREMVTRIPAQKPPRKTRKARMASAQAEGSPQNARQQYDVRSAGQAGAAAIRETGQALD